MRQYQRFFEFDGVELEFKDDALRAISEQAILRGTGARGLRAIMEEVLLNVMYELPSREDVTKCLVDKDVVLTGVNPTLVPHAKHLEEAERPPGTHGLARPRASQESPAVAGNRRRGDGRFPRQTSREGYGWTRRSGGRPPGSRRTGGCS